MTNLRSTIVPKSDQLNFDDFVGSATMTIKVTKVSKVTGDQPIAINFENDNGKPYKPCKSMRRVLIHCWGEDGNKFVGRYMTLYGDPTVKFGGGEVGGIRISHLSDIEQDEMTMALTATRASRKPYTVRRLTAQQQSAAPQQQAAPAGDALKDEVAELGRSLDMAENAAEVEKLLKKCDEVAQRISAVGRTKLYDWLFEKAEAARGRFAVNPIGG